MKIALIVGLSILSLQTFAQGHYKNHGEYSRWTYDLSASAGSQGESNYTEINLGLNWFVTDWMNWRNAIFSRQGTGVPSVQGLDSSFRLISKMGSPEDVFGIDAFAGPGLRMATNDYNAVFGEAGLVFRLGGLRIGAGAKSLHYLKDREYEGSTYPKDETQYFLVLGGGGSF